MIAETFPGAPSVHGTTPLRRLSTVGNDNATDSLNLEQDFADLTDSCKTNFLARVAEFEGAELSLGQDAMHRLSCAGYYSVEVGHSIKVVALNTNIWRFKTPYKEADPHDQFAWLERQLHD